jgi:hypothetical protein
MSHVLLRALGVALVLTACSGRSVTVTGGDDEPTREPTHVRGVDSEVEERAVPTPELVVDGSACSVARAALDASRDDQWWVLEIDAMCDGFVAVRVRGRVDAAYPQTVVGDEAAVLTASGGSIFRASPADGGWSKISTGPTRSARPAIRGEAWLVTSGGARGDVKLIGHDGHDVRFAIPF